MQIRTGAARTSRLRQYASDAYRELPRRHGPQASMEPLGQRLRQRRYGELPSDAQNPGWPSTHGFAAHAEASIPYFGAPLVSYAGTTTGVADHADSARTLMERAPTFVSFPAADGRARR